MLEQAGSKQIDDAPDGAATTGEGEVGGKSEETAFGSSGDGPVAKEDEVETAGGDVAMLSPAMSVYLASVRRSRARRMKLTPDRWILLSTACWTPCRWAADACRQFWA